MRLVALLLTLALAMPAAAQISTPIPCVHLAEDGRTGPAGYYFVSLMDGRVAVLLTRSTDRISEATDFVAVPNRPGVSFYQVNFDVRIGERPRTLFMMTTVRSDGTILFEEWDRRDRQPTAFTAYVLRCTP